MRWLSVLKKRFRISWISSILVHSVFNHSHQRRLRHRSRKLPGSRIPGRQAWRFPAVYRCLPPTLPRPTKTRTAQGRKVQSHHRSKSSHQGRAGGLLNFALRHVTTSHARHPEHPCKPNVPVVQRSLIGRVSHQNSMCMKSHIHSGHPGPPFELDRAPNWRRQVDLLPHHEADVSPDTFGICDNGQTSEQASEKGIKKGGLLTGRARDFCSTFALSPLNARASMPTI